MAINVLFLLNNKEEIRQAINFETQFSRKSSSFINDYRR